MDKVKTSADMEEETGNRTKSSRMSPRRWIIVGISLALACLLIVGLGGLYLVRNMPGAARLIYGHRSPPATFTPLPEASRPPLPIATLTPMPTSTPPQVAAEALPGPSALPTVPFVVATDDRPTAESTSLPSPTTEPPTSTPQPPTPTPRPPTPTPRPQWIAFETKRGEFSDYEIFVMAPDGSRLRNLTESWADDVAPVWSPDGQRIAFVSFRDTLTGKWGLENSSIYIIAFDPMTGRSSGTPRRLTDGQGKAGWPTWSPDGQRIAFHSDRSGDWDIWVINTDGSGLTNLTKQPGNDQYPAWSPDGATIAFTSKRGGNDDVWIVKADGSDPVNLTRAPGRDRYPMWSPDGKKLTFNTKRDGNFEVYVMNADGSNPRNVSRSPASTEGLAAWSPDGDYLVLYSDRPGNKDVFVLNLATGQWTNITNNPASDEFCTWSP